MFTLPFTSSAEEFETSARAHELAAAQHAESIAYWLARGDWRRADEAAELAAAEHRAAETDRTRARQLKG